MKRILECLGLDQEDLYTDMMQSQQMRGRLTLKDELMQIIQMPHPLQLPHMMIRFLNSSGILIESYK